MKHAISTTFRESLLIINFKFNKNIRHGFQGEEMSPKTLLRSIFHEARIKTRKRRRMPHAGIEPATFCLLDRRSAPEPMRHMGCAAHTAYAYADNMYPLGKFLEQKTTNRPFHACPRTQAMNSPREIIIQTVHKSGINRSFTTCISPPLTLLRKLKLGSATTSRELALISTLLGETFCRPFYADS